MMETNPTNVLICSGRQSNKVFHRMYAYEDYSMKTVSVV